MRRIFRRQILSVALALGGVAALVYGSQFHFVQLVEEKEVHETRQVRVKSEATEAPPIVLHGSSAWGGDASADDSVLSAAAVVKSEPTFVAEKVTRIAKVAQSESEPSLLRELTLGHVTLREGELQWVHREDGAALCPT